MSVLFHATFPLEPGGDQTAQGQEGRSESLMGPSSVTE